MDIDQYLESFNFITKYRSLIDKYNLLDNNDRDEPNFSDFINKIKIFIKKDDNLSLSPQKAFKCLLDVLHNKFKQNEFDNTAIKSAEMNRENAFKSFKIFKQKDRSIISDKFFGIKLIEKKCKNCNLTNFVYKYLKTIEIDVENVDEGLILNIEKCIKKITKSKFNKNNFCSICSSTQEHEINIEIIELPEILILIFPQTEETKFEITEELINKKYDLIYSKIKSNKKNILSDLCNSFSSSNNNIPLVLIYKNKENKIKQNIDEKIVEVIQDKQYSFFDNTIDVKLNGNKFDDILISEKNEQPSNEELKSNAENKITLYFRTKEEKEMYIETYDNNTFNEIVKELNENYEVNFDKNKMYFNNKHIDLKKTPKDYKIPSGEFIMIEE